MVTKIYVVRHGESTANRDNIVSGHTDPPLTEDGKQQAGITRGKLARIHFDEVYSSDLKRAVQTAEIIYGKPVPADHKLFSLRERNFGLFDGKPGKHLAALRDDPAYLSMSDTDRWTHKHAADMESDHEVVARFEAALKAIAEHNRGKTVLVAAHGGTLRTLLINLGYATQNELRFGSIQNASFAELIYSNGKFSMGRVSGVNKSAAA